MKIRSAVAIGVFAVTACFARAVVADEPAAGSQKKEALSPEAEALFVDGRKLFDARRFAEACDKLTESHKLTPSVKALGLLAACHEEQGKITTAYYEYLEVAERAQKVGDSRETFARKRAEDLKGMLPVVHIEITRPEPGLLITQNGKAVAEDAISELYLDPGTVEIVAQAPGKEPWRTHVIAVAKARINITIPELTPATSTNILVPTSMPGAQVSTSPAEKTSTMRVAGFITGAAGLATIALGSAFGVNAIRLNNRSKADNHCDSKNVCDKAGERDRNAARASAGISTTFFTVGIAGVVTGAVLVFISPSPSQPRAATAKPLRVSVAGDPGGAGVMVSGSF